MTTTHKVNMPSAMAKALDMPADRASHYKGRKKSSHNCATELTSDRDPALVCRKIEVVTVRRPAVLSTPEQNATTEEKKTCSCRAQLRHALWFPTTTNPHPRRMVEDLDRQVLGVAEDDELASRLRGECANFPTCCVEFYKHMREYKAITEAFPAARDTTKL